MKTYKLLPALLIATAITACTSKSNQQHDHDEKIQLTAYSNDFEIFAEATPFIVGHSSDMLAHFTSLQNFKPLPEGSITVNLIIGNDGIRQTVEKPIKTGIYGFSLKPSVAGTGKLIFDINTAGKTYQIIIPDIKVYANEEEAFHTLENEEISNSNTVVFTKEQSWKIDFATELVKREPFGQVIKTTAQILPSLGDEQIITAKTNGIVTFSDNNIIEGKNVNKGQILLSIASDGMADNNLSVRYSEAENEYQRAKTEYERKKELAKDKIVSDSELMRAKNEFETAENTYNNLRQNFSKGKQIVNLPFSGYITQVFVQNGGYVETGQPIARISQNMDLLMKAELQPKYFPLLGAIVSANIKVLDTHKTYTLEELNGKVVSYGKSVDMNNPLIPVVFQIRNKVGLLSGSFVEMYIKTQTNSQALTVANEAIIEEMGNYFVYVQLSPELFEKRTIRKGVTDGLYTEIQEGISENERIVSKGAILVKLAQSSGALDAHSGHAH